MSVELKTESKDSKLVRYPKMATPTRFLFALFLVATGLMTMMFGIQGYPLPEAPSPFRDFMEALENTGYIIFWAGYIIFWVGLVKFVAGSLLWSAETTPP